MSDQYDVKDQGDGDWEESLNSVDVEGEENERALEADRKYDELTCEICRGSGDGHGMDEECSNCGGEGRLKDDSWGTSCLEMANIRQQQAWFNKLYWDCFGIREEKGGKNRGDEG